MSNAYKKIDKQGADYRKNLAKKNGVGKTTALTVGKSLILGSRATGAYDAARGSGASRGQAMKTAVVGTGSGQDQYGMAARDIRKKYKK